jgi:hypothetical protein
MKRLIAGALLGGSLGWWTAGAGAEELIWRPARERPAATAGTLSPPGRPALAVTLGRPVALSEPQEPSPGPQAVSEPGGRLASAGADMPSRRVVRAQSDEELTLPLPGASPATPPVRRVPAVPFASDSMSVEALPDVIPHPAANLAACGPAECFAAEACGPVGGRFYAGAEYLYWWIRDTRVPPLVTTGPVASQGILGMPGTMILLGAKPLDNEERSGARFTAGYWLDDCRTLGLEGSFFFLADRSVPFRFSSNQFPLLARPFFNLNAGTEFAQVATSPGVATGSVTTELRSQLLGADANLRYNLYCGCSYRVDLLAGFRYLDLEESLDITEDLTALPGRSVPAGTHIIVADHFGTRDQFYGGQLGAVAEFRRGKWFLDLKTKVAIGDTRQTIDIRGNQVITAPGGMQSTFTGGLLALNSNIGHFQRDSFSIVPEVGLNVGYQFTDHLRAFVGYNFLFWSDVVRPGDQIDRGLDVTRIPNFGVPATPLAQPRPAVPFKETGFWAQGINFGVEFRF